jgi:hypothetical protein
MSRAKCDGTGVDRDRLKQNFDFGDVNMVPVVITPATSRVINTFKKNLLIMKEIITVYHPDYISNESLRSYGLKEPCNTNIPRLVEQSLAAVGGYTFVDANGYDFSDYSDSKTTTDAEYDRAMRIGNVQNKIGALRITTYNPHNDTLSYFFMPKSAVDEFKENNGTFKDKNGERIRTTWKKKTDHYNFFESFRLQSFEKLALAS